MGDRIAVRQIVLGRKPLVVAIQLDHRAPGRGLAGIAGEYLLHVQDPRQIFRPLDITGHPEYGLRVARQQHQ